MKLDAVVLGKGLHKLESYSATRQVFVWIRRIRTFGIQNGGSRWKYLIGYMMVADNEIDAFFFGVTDFFYRFNTTVQYDDQFYSGGVSVVYSFFRHTIPFIISVGDIIIDVRVELLKKFENKGDSRSAVHVIISIHQDTLFSSHGQV